MAELLPFTRYGPLDVPGGADLISRFLADFGEWSFLETQFVTRHVPRQAKILDAGGFVGTFALSTLRRSPASLVTVEANPEILPLLKNNFGRLAPSTFVVEHGVLGDGTVPSSSPRAVDPENIGSFSFTASEGEVSGTAWDIVPPALTLPGLRKRHGDFDFIKLDIEGSELTALRMDEAWLGLRKPTLWVECNENPQSLALYAFIASLGYEIHYFAYPSYNPDNFLGNPTPIFPIAHEAGLLATAPGLTPSLSYELAGVGCDLIRVQDADHLRACLWVTPRWGLAEWAEMPRSRLLATISRLHRRQNFDDFLERP